VAVAFSDQQLTGLALYHVPTIRMATRESFTAGPRVWNSLPPNLRRDIATDNLTNTENISVWAVTDQAHYDLCFPCALEILLLTYFNLITFHCF